MAVRLSRRKIAGYIASGLASGKDSKRLIQELAGFLIDSRRTKELELVVRDIEYELASQGIVLARITSAHDLTSATEAAIKALIKNQTNANTIELSQFIDPSVIGGVRIDLPSSRMDGTIARKLTTLRMNVKK
jgi:F-type H+-transporting ATPase subunit delta